jgi:arylsulfatase B
MLLLAALLVGLAPTLQDQQGAIVDLQPNVLLVVWDDLSADDPAPTPRFDDLAGRGVRYTRMYTNPRCSPSRHSLHFGEAWVSADGEACGAGAIEFPLVPSIARDHNGPTLLVGKWHLGRHDDPLLPWELSAQMVAGFDDWRAGISANVNSQTCPPPGTYVDWTRVESGTSFRSAFYQTQAVENVTTGAMATLEEPWFIMACFQAPHRPYHVPPGVSLPPTSTNRTRYEAMVADLDESTGALIDAADLGDTIVIVISDNGTPQDVPWLGADGSRLKGTTYEGGVRVRAAWAGPRVAPRQVTAVVSFADLRGMIAARSPVPPLNELVFVGTDSGEVDDLAVVGARWKYAELGGTPRLHDLDSDPDELVNLSGTPQYAVLEAQLKDALERLDPRK